MVKDALGDILGKRLPSDLTRFMEIVENLLRYTARTGAVHASHEKGTWRLLCLMFAATASGVSGERLLSALSQSTKRWLDSTMGDYMTTLSEINLEQQIHAMRAAANPTWNQPDTHQPPSRGTT